MKVKTFSFFRAASVYNCVHLERCFAFEAGVDQQVTLPGNGEVEYGERQGAIARRPQATHVVAPTHRVDDHRPVLGHREWKHTLNKQIKNTNMTIFGTFIKMKNNLSYIIPNITIN